jgi:hypothetical protein
VACAQLKDMITFLGDSMVGILRSRSDREAEMLYVERIEEQEMFSDRWNLESLSRYNLSLCRTPSHNPLEVLRLRY